MTIERSDLPGVGEKYVIDLSDGTELIIVTHNTGKREVFRRSDPTADSEKLFELRDEQARTVGTILEGAYFQPVESEKQKTTLPGGIVLEWYEVESDSPLIGETIEGADIGRRTGAKIVAIQRETQTIASPDPAVEFRGEDTVIVVGTEDQCDAFERLLTGAD
ncbi:cation:proton antiporter regulatory subunit [Halanaeroarchaeum sulfurireducens]|uniref:TrkA-C domain-containing protein n=1 Tax=Halanaeroarchaeum sulfurireducens TaxID=1604004 RepID=A0A0F7P888_9EURY|nr:TrkA C-terminal domain-containing protein [Halanaeroarchaeum sulfurireducens]AKH96942.1 TrkA-C domain-containing protein [Halanaeroarchaeum sulfurireducens]ALG81343.1 TrkA-C domain-containing protein [Halanaeroarchaeum sulfurireducens]